MASMSLPFCGNLPLDYFEMIPNDILYIILSFIDSLKDSFSLLKVSKRFYHFIKPDETRWKALCLQFWKDYKQQLTQKEGNRNYSREGEYDLVLAQRESGKDWFWFSQCFVNGRFIENDEDNRLWIGVTPGQEGNSWGICIYPFGASMGNFIDNDLEGDGIDVGTGNKYVGQFENGRNHGIGTFTYNSGIKYEGGWYDEQFHGLGSITYPDGIQYEGQWNKNQPGFDARHPIVKEYVEQGLCTNTLPQLRMDNWLNYCETCWLYCQQKSSIELEWCMEALECNCDDCLRRSKKQKENKLFGSRIDLQSLSFKKDEM